MKRKKNAARSRSYAIRPFHQEVLDSSVSQAVQAGWPANPSIIVRAALRSFSQLTPENQLQALQHEIKEGADVP